jgi:hypothetical protein
VHATGGNDRGTIGGGKESIETVIAAASRVDQGSFPIREIIGKNGHNARHWRRFPYVWQIKGKKVSPAGKAKCKGSHCQFLAAGSQGFISLSGSLRHKKIPRSGGIKG